MQLFNFLSKSSRMLTVPRYNTIKYICHACTFLKKFIKSKTPQLLFESADEVLVKTQKKASIRDSATKKKNHRKRRPNFCYLKQYFQQKRKKITEANRDLRRRSLGSAPADAGLLLTKTETVHVKTCNINSLTKERQTNKQQNLMFNQ